MSRSELGLLGEYATEPAATGAVIILHDSAPDAGDG